MKKQTEGEARRSTRKQRDELIRIGSMMANMCFNIKQWPEIPERVRETARELQEQWDKIRMELANAK